MIKEKFKRMKEKNMGLFRVIIICSYLLILAEQTSSRSLHRCPFNYIYHFGDGVSDIGNSIRRFNFGPLLPAARFPYGETYPGKPTGRWSDGRLIVDYAARGLGFTQIEPYLNRSGSDNNGVVFAVEGSPVLDGLFYATKGIVVPSHVAPLNEQLQWFKQYQESTCSTPTDCKNRLGDSLIVMGDIEGNDIRYPLLHGKSIQDIQTNYVPLVIQTLIDGIREVIRAGANRIIVPGNVPLGCYPSILSAFPSINNPSLYDDLGCLKSVNDLVVFKNNLLQTALRSLTLEFPNVTMIYADFYTVVQSVLRQATLLGFDNNTLLKACCGFGGPYNYDERRFCGSFLVPVCSNPKKYIHWDGIHLTQEANYKISKILTEGFLPTLDCI